MKRTSIIILAILVSLLLVHCGGAGDTKEAEQLAKDYEALQTSLKEKVKTIDSREAFKDFMAERKKQMEELLKKAETAGDSDIAELVRGKLLLSLKKFDEALVKFDALIEKKAANALEAKFGKVQVLAAKRDQENALVLFKEIKDKVKKDMDYYSTLFDFIYAGKDLDLRMAYSKELLKNIDNYQELANYKNYVYENMAGIERERGNKDKAIEILEKAIADTQDERSKRSLTSALAQLKLIGSPAPEIAAEQWDNSKALTLAKLKGKAVIIDFWAPWCGPCRKVIPTLVKCYDELKDEGLVVIGFTKIYGRYSDDTQDKGKVDRDTESGLIKDYVKRKAIPYPIAIADQGTAFDAYGVSGIPTMVMIDKEGNIKDIQVGSGDEAGLEEKIKALLK